MARSTPPRTRQERSLASPPGPLAPRNPAIRAAVCFEAISDRLTKLSHARLASVLPRSTLSHKSIATLLSLFAGVGSVVVDFVPGGESRMPLTESEMLALNTMGVVGAEAGFELSRMMSDSRGARRCHSSKGFLPWTTCRRIEDRSGRKRPVTQTPGHPLSMAVVSRSDR